MPISSRLKDQVIGLGKESFKCNKFPTSLSRQSTVRLTGFFEQTVAYQMAERVGFSFTALSTKAGGWRMIIRITGALDTLESDQMMTCQWTELI